MCIHTLYPVTRNSMKVSDKERVKQNIRQSNGRGKALDTVREWQNNNARIKAKNLVCS